MLADLPVPVAKAAAWNAVLSETDGGRVGRCRRERENVVTCGSVVQSGDTLIGGRIVVRLRRDGSLALWVPWDWD